MKDENILLIVESRQNLRELFSYCLQKIGASLRLVSNGREARSFLLSEPVTAVLSEVELPELDGVGLLRELRGHQYETPFVLIGDLCEPQDLQAALRLGATDVLLKPFPVSTLRTVVSRALELGKAQKALDQELDFISVDNRSLQEKIAHLHQCRRSFWCDHDDEVLLPRSRKSA